MTADERRTGPPAAHADLDTLADLQAGVLDGSEAGRVREHVAGCRQCAATLEALDAVQEQLRSVPAPTIPAAVAARLDAALAGLRTERPVPAGGATAADPEDELARARARRGRRLSRAIGAAAAAVVVIAAGGAIASIVRGGGGETASSGAGSAASAPVQPQESGAALPKTAAGGSLDNSGGQPVLPAYDQASLRAALPTIAGQGVAPRATPPGDAARQAACADSIPGAQGSLRGVQHIRYDGRPAYVFVYADGARLTGFVVTEVCGSAPGLPAAVLDTVS
jgi:hypothetical protein